ncbi:MAG: glutathione peroxidase [Saprospiraceae bacterium]|nr:glutathione peroxidase [Saprospiraceae bacterium]
MKSSLFLFLLAALIFSSCFNSSKVASRPAETASTTMSKPAAILPDFTVNSLDGQPVSLSQYRGKKIIILNVASKCGYTPQYADWQLFYEAHKENFVVLGFPCNDFGYQEPGSAGEIAEFCQKNYGVSFPMFEKVHVKGDNQAPLFRWLSDPAQNGWNSDVPSWNFCKYLINEKGELTHFFGSKVEPDSPEFKAAAGI